MSAEGQIASPSARAHAANKSSNRSLQNGKQQRRGGVNRRGGRRKDKPKQAGEAALCQGDKRSEKASEEDAHRSEAQASGANAKNNQYDNQSNNSSSSASAKQNIRGGNSSNNKRSRGGKKQSSGSIKQHILNDDGKAATKLFIRIPQDVNEDHLRQHFQQFGTLSDVYIPRVSSKKPDAEHRGFGFVTYENVRDAANAAAATTQYVHGAELHVDRAVPKPQSRDATLTQAEQGETAMRQPSDVDSSTTEAGMQRSASTSLMNSLSELHEEERKANEAAASPPQYDVRALARRVASSVDLQSDAVPSPLWQDHEQQMHLQQPLAQRQLFGALEQQQQQQGHGQPLAGMSQLYMRRTGEQMQADQVAPSLFTGMHHHHQQQNNTLHPIGAADPTAQTPTFMTPSSTQAWSPLQSPAGSDSALMAPSEAATLAPASPIVSSKPTSATLQLGIEPGTLVQPVSQSCICTTHNCS